MGMILCVLLLQVERANVSSEDCKMQEAEGSPVMVILGRLWQHYRVKETLLQRENGILCIFFKCY